MEIITGFNIPLCNVSYVKASNRRVKVQESAVIGYFLVFIDDKLGYFFAPCTKNKYEPIANIQMLQTVMFIMTNRQVFLTTLLVNAVQKRKYQTRLMRNRIQMTLSKYYLFQERLVFPPEVLILKTIITLSQPTHYSRNMESLHQEMHIS